MTTRTDVHSPVNLTTEDYEYVFAMDLQSPWALGMNQTEQGREFLRELAEGIQRSPMADRGYSQCHHCGAHLRYTAILKHVPTGAYIAVGETCLDNRFALATAEFQRLRKAAELDRKVQRIKTAAREFVDNLTGDAKVALDRDIDLREAFPFIEEHSYAHSTIEDIKRKVWTYYGNASERQVAFVEKLIAQSRERAERDARIAAERASETRVDAPEGRLAFEGVVVSRRWKDSEYGGGYKLVVKVDDQERGGVWLVYVSEPSKIATERGDVVRMTAALTRSDRDRSFAFGKRPTKAEIVGNVGEVEEYESDSLA